MSDSVESLPLFKGDNLPCAYSGFLEVAKDKYFFYWYFYNTTQPNFPMTIWLNGGPGSSSMTGLFGEQGPLQFSNPNDITLTFRTGSWLEKSHMIFIDQPAGTGLSYNNANIFP